MKLARAVAIFAAVVWLVAGCVMAHAEFKGGPSTQSLYGTTDQDFLLAHDRWYHVRTTEEYIDDLHRFNFIEEDDPYEFCRHAVHIPQCLEARDAMLKRQKTEKKI
jgi:hypothetical protein